MQRRLWTQMCTLFNKNMKYDPAAGVLKDTYKNVNKTCSPRSWHGYKTRSWFSPILSCRVQFREGESGVTNPASFHSHGNTKDDEEDVLKAHLIALKHLEMYWLCAASLFSNWLIAINIPVWKELTIRLMDRALRVQGFLYTFDVATKKHKALK